MEAKETGKSYVPRKVVLEKLNLVQEKLESKKKDHYSLTISLQLPQKKLDRVRGELKEKKGVIESSWEAAKAKKRGEEG